MNDINSNPEKNLINVFIFTLIGSILLRTVLAIVMPFTGDEAYFAIWGMYPALGYYDHTPLIGWILYLLLKINDSQVILRFPSIILPAIISSTMFAVLKNYDYRKALLIAILYLISPINLYLVLISTDTPVVLFTFLSGVALLLAIKKQDNLICYCLSGICLGLAFLSKYFAVLLALAYIIYYLCTQKTTKRTIGFFLLFICVLPFGMINLYWNYTHMWANILFNAYNRNSDMLFNINTVGKYLLDLFYIITPFICYYLCKYSKALFGKYLQSEFLIISYSFIVPLSFFLILSFVKDIGFHWMLSFIPFIYFSLIRLVNENELKRIIKYMAWFSAIHIIILTILLSMPLSAWKYIGFKNKYADVVYFFKHKEIRDYLSPYDNDFIFASHSYAQADIMFFDSGKYSPDIGMGSVHGRQGDFLTDYSIYYHHNFLILEDTKPTLSDYAPYFKRIEEHTFIFDGATFYYVLAYDFNFPKYRDIVLRKINDTYWKAPKYLPHTASFYCEKYFKSEGCKANAL